MTISTTTVSQSYSGDGSTTAFTYSFPINSTSEIKVIERAATGAETIKSEGTGSANYGIVDNGASGGTVTMVTAPASGTTLVLIRDTGLTQGTDYVENDPFPAETHEDALDKLQMQIQEVQEEVDRSMKLSRTNTMTSTEFTNSATDRASKVLAFDSSGELSVTQELGTFKGDSATTTTAAYVKRDIVKSTTTAQLNNIYICIQASPVGTALTNTSYWTLIVDAVTAATSATTATTKASEAATSATNAAASYDSFDDRYLGAKSSDPSTDNDGDALATGALYFKTDGTGMKVYNGSAWKDIRPTDAQQTNIDTVAGANSNISALAASAVIADMALLATTDVIADMALLATTDVISDMNALAVSDVISDINTLATSDIVSDLNTLATSDIVSDINTLATSDIVSDLNTLATSDIVSDINTLATSDIVTDLNLLATSDFVSDLNTLATSTNVTNIANLNASGVLTNIANLNASGVVANIATVAGAVTNVNNVGGSISNVNTVASNLSAVNNFADVYRIASSAPTSSLTAGDLYFNTSTNVLNVYGASGWQNAGSSVNGTAQRYHYDISGTPTAVTGSDAAGNTLAYDAGFVDVYLNGVRMSTADVTVTSGDTVTFASALTNGDEVDIVAFGTFSVASLNADNLSSGTVPVARVAGSYTGVTGTGALNAGTITSGFGNIDTGSSTITTTGAVAIGALTQNGGAVFNEDSADVDFRIEGNGDANAFFLDGEVDRIYLGHNADTDINGLNARLQISGTDFDKSSASLIRYSADANPPSIGFAKSRNASIAGNTIVQDGDNLGRIRFAGADGGDFANVAGQIDCQVDGTPGVNDMPGRLIFSTGADGATSATERVRIHSGGVMSASQGIALGVGTANTASNVLDDYEEGTFTPDFDDSSNNSPSSMHAAQGFYTKVGRAVHIQIYVEINSKGSGMSGNVMRISGLPFAPVSSGLSFNSLATSYISNIDINGAPVAAAVYASNSFIYLYYISGDNSAQITPSMIIDGSRFTAGGTYMTD